MGSMGSVERWSAAAIAVLTAFGLAACGGGSSSSSTTSSQPTSTESNASDTAAARKALGAYEKAIGQYNAGFDAYMQKEPADAQAGDILGVRRDAYNFRNVVYDYDKAIRAVDFPPSVQPDVNTLLEANSKQISQLDDISQSESIKEINAFLSRALVALGDPSLKVTNDLRSILGQKPAQPEGGTPTQSDLADALTKGGLVKSADADCVAQQILKNLGSNLPFDVGDSGIQALMDGSADKTVQAKVAGALQLCQLMG